MSLNLDFMDCRDLLRLRIPGSFYPNLHSEPDTENLVETTMAHAQPEQPSVHSPISDDDLPFDEDSYSMPGAFKQDTPRDPYNEIPLDVHKPQIVQVEDGLLSQPPSIVCDAESFVFDQVDGRKLSATVISCEVPESVPLSIMTLLDVKTDNNSCTTAIYCRMPTECSFTRPKHADNEVTQCVAEEQSTEFFEQGLEEAKSVASGVQAPQEDKEVSHPVNLGKHSRSPSPTRAWWNSAKSSSLPVEVSKRCNALLRDTRKPRYYGDISKATKAMRLIRQPEISVKPCAAVDTPDRLPNAGHQSLSLPVPAQRSIQYTRKAYDPSPTVLENPWITKQEDHRQVVPSRGKALSDAGKASVASGPSTASSSISASASCSILCATVCHGDLDEVARKQGVVGSNEDGCDGNNDHDVPFSPLLIPPQAFHRDVISDHDGSCYDKSLSSPSWDEAPLQSPSRRRWFGHLKKAARKVLRRVKSSGSRSKVQTTHDRDVPAPENVSENSAGSAQQRRREKGMKQLINRMSGPWH